VSDIIGYEYVPEEGWHPVGSGTDWCSYCGANGHVSYDCEEE